MPLPALAFTELLRAAETSSFPPAAAAWEDAVQRDVGPGPVRAAAWGPILGVSRSPAADGPALSERLAESPRRSDRKLAREVRSTLDPLLDEVLGDLVAAALEADAAAVAALGGPGATWMDVAREDVRTWLEAPAPDDEAAAARFRTLRARLKDPPAAFDPGGMYAAGVRWNDAILDAATRLASLPPARWPAEPWIVLSEAGPIWIGSPDHNVGSGVPFLIVDPGGDDHWRIEARDEGWSTPWRVRGVVELGGDDTFHSEGLGATGALFGLTAAVDVEGHDTHRGGALDQGAAAFGMASLVDLGGDDLYVAGRGAQGFGLHGAGFLRDDRGSDLLSAAGYAQGSAVSGLGVWWDGAGPDAVAALPAGGRTGAGPCSATAFQHGGAPGMAWARAPGLPVRPEGNLGPGGHCWFGTRASERATVRGGVRWSGPPGQPAAPAHAPMDGIHSPLAWSTGEAWVDRQARAGLTAPAEVERWWAGALAAPEDAIWTLPAFGDAARAGALPVPALLDGWVALRSHADPRVRAGLWCAVTVGLSPPVGLEPALAAEVEAEAATWLRAGTSLPSPESRPCDPGRASWELLHHQGTSSSLSAMVAAFPPDSHPSLAAAGDSLLAVARRSEGVAVLRALGPWLNGPTPQRVMAIRALVPRALPEVDALLPAALSDPAPEVRKAAIEAAGSRSTEPTIRKLLDAARKDGRDEPERGAAPPR